jgi:hypothetical protein
VVERILLVWRRLVVERPIDGAVDRVPAEESHDGDACAHRGGIASIIDLGVMKGQLAVSTADVIMTNCLDTKPRVEITVSGGVSPAGAQPLRAGLAWAPVVRILHGFPIDTFRCACLGWMTSRTRRLRARRP